jgi:hypothetical protein
VGRPQQRRVHADPLRGLFEDGSEAAVDRLDTLLGGGSKDSDNSTSDGHAETEVSPERVPEPTLTAGPSQQEHSEEAFRLVKPSFVGGPKWT